MFTLLHNICPKYTNGTHIAIEIIIPVNGLIKLIKL